jgi:hypothetical protein
MQIKDNDNTFFIVLLLSYISKYKIKNPTQKGRTKSKNKHILAKKQQEGSLAFGLHMPKTDFTDGFSPKTKCGIRTLTVVTAATEFHRAFPQNRLYFVFIIKLFVAYVNNYCNFI